ncbi:hypothetical protein JTE90_023373 [Oedothorax gibbosus]|uniref:Uncharacterized protein n=1 Tax=Oedothorax gibbosus TaxID=931172 RepID=A0AAV6V1W0_9ARAC|nr:hypothetical protein JTE90_023373 [Oedothorax gibbosus]
MNGFINILLWDGRQHFIKALIYRILDTVPLRQNRLSPSLPFSQKTMKTEAVPVACLFKANISIGLHKLIDNNANVRFGELMQNEILHSKL